MQGVKNIVQIYFVRCIHSHFVLHLLIFACYHIVRNTLVNRRTQVFAGICIAPLFEDNFYI